MNGRDALKAARGAGITIQVQGRHLLLEAAAPPPPGLVDLLARHKTEVISLLEGLILEWMNQHPEPSDPGQCAWCGKRETDAAMVVPFGVEPGTHTWIHPECWAAWHKARRDRAMTAIGERI